LRSWWWLSYSRNSKHFMNPEGSLRVHKSLSLAMLIQATFPDTITWRYVLVLCSHLRLGLPSALFPSGFPPPKPSMHLSSLRATCHRPSHSSWLDWLNIYCCEKYWEQALYGGMETSFYVLKFLGAFAKLGKMAISFFMSVCLTSVRPHGTTRLPLDGFSCNLTCEYCSKIPHVAKL
jgi:hypothetical protein